MTIWLVHSNLYDYGGAASAGQRRRCLDERRREEFRHLEFETEHPVVRHPETAGPWLLVGHFARSFAGLSNMDWAELFGLLQRHITRLEKTVR